MSTRYEQYYTGLVPLEIDVESGMQSAKGRGWEARLIPARPRMRGGGDTHEVVIMAGKPLTAQRAADLINNALSLIHGEPLMDRIEAVEDKAFKYRFSTGDIPLACQVAAKVSTRPTLVYALALYRSSQNLHANPVMDLEPHMYPHEHRSPYPADHVRFAYAIVTAYAVLETLRLALPRAEFKNRKWIPQVRNHLERRLGAAGVDLKESALWQLRGDKTELEELEKRPLKMLPRSPASWAHGEIRDCDIAVVDAVADLKWLRNAVASHKLDELVSLLSIYDVANAQYLARRLLCAKLGLSA